MREIPPTGHNIRSIYWKELRRATFKEEPDKNILRLLHPSSSVPVDKPHAIIIHPLSFHLSRRNIESNNK